jgi:hypothetical protein
MSQYALKFPEISPALGPVVDGIQVGVSAYNGYQNGGGASGALAAGGKELAKTVVDDCVTAAVTCMAAETGPFAPAIGIAAGKAAGAATEYLIDHPDTLLSAFACDENGICVDSPMGPGNIDMQGSGMRQQMENSFDQTSAQNAAAAADEAQQLADAQAAQPSGPDSGMSDFLAGISAGLANSAATLQSRAPQGTAAPTASATASTAIPSGWVACDCPAQHASLGRFINGQLYHPPSPKCH